MREPEAAPTLGDAVAARATSIGAPALDRGADIAAGSPNMTAGTKRGKRRTLDSRGVASGGAAGAVGAGCLVSVATAGAGCGADNTAAGRPPPAPSAVNGWNTGAANERKTAVDCGGSGTSLAGAGIAIGTQPAVAKDGAVGARKGCVVSKTTVGGWEAGNTCASGR